LRSGSGPNSLVSSIVTSLSSPGISCISRRSSDVLPLPVLPVAPIV